DGAVREPRCGGGARGAARRREAGPGQLHCPAEDGRALDATAHLQEGGRAHTARSLAGAEPRADGAGAPAGRRDPEDAAGGNRTRRVPEPLGAAGAVAPPVETAT